MKAVFEPTGTHWHKRPGALVGKVKVRVDLFPDPIENPVLFAVHNVDQPAREYTPEELADESLRALVPTHKKLSPCQGHFLSVDPDITPGQLRKLIRQTFDANTLRILADALAREDGGRTVHLAMKGKKGRGARVRSFDQSECDSLNERLKGVEVVVSGRD